MVKISRKNFITAAFSSAACLCGGCVSFPTIARSRGGKVNLAFVGIGNRGADNFKMFSYYPNLINVVALCDTELGSKRTLGVLKLAPNVPRYRDFRKMFDELGKDIDAVVISTPDFSHFPVAMLAMSLGKAVYCEKPMGNCFREIGLMTAAAARHGVVTQMGNQGHSDGNFWQCKALIEAGFFKNVIRIDAFMCEVRRWHKWAGSMTVMPGGEIPPASLDWDVWQSQRPVREFSTDYINGDWRSFYEYGTGALGDWGTHIFDAPWELLQMGLPSEIEVLAENGRTDAVYPLSSTIVFRFPARSEKLPACEIIWRDGLGNFPALPEPITAKRWKRGKCGSEIRTSDGLVFARGTHGATMQLIAGADPQSSVNRKLMRTYPKDKSGHYLNFLKAVRGEEKANSSFAVAGELSQVVSLGALAQRLGVGKFRFDITQRKFVDNEVANRYLHGLCPRPGWEEFEKL